MKQSEKVELVKRIPIQKYFDDVIVPNMGDYYGDSLVDFDVKNVVKCPLHTEDTPSMRYYSETNTFYCWGCRRGGDIIELHRQFCSINLNSEYSFENTLEFLYKRYIENRNTELVSNSIKKKEVEIENSEKELYRYKRKWLQLESQLQIEKGLDISRRIILYERLDTLYNLVTQNKLDVADALKLLQSIGDDNAWT